MRGILFVEDDPLIRENLSELLREEVEALKQHRSELERARPVAARERQRRAPRRTG